MRPVASPRLSLQHQFIDDCCTLAKFAQVGSASLRCVGSLQRLAFPVDPAMLAEASVLFVEAPSNQRRFGGIFKAVVPFELHSSSSDSCPTGSTSPLVTDMRAQALAFATSLRFCLASSEWKAAAQRNGVLSLFRSYCYNIVQISWVRGPSSHTESL